MHFLVFVVKKGDRFHKIYFSFHLVGWCSVRTWKSRPHFFKFVILSENQKSHVRLWFFIKLHLWNALEVKPLAKILANLVDHVGRFGIRILPRITRTQCNGKKYAIMKCFVLQLKVHHTSHLITRPSSTWISKYSLKEVKASLFFN